MRSAYRRSTVVTTPSKRPRATVAAWLDTREVAAERVVFDAVEQQVALYVAQFAYGCVRVEGEAVVLPRGPQDRDVARGQHGQPAEHGPRRDAQPVVDQSAHIGMEHGADTGAGGARAAWAC